MRCRFLSIACLLSVIFLPTFVWGQENGKTDLLSLILIPADLVDAKKAMLVHDPNNDGSIDSDEQKRLSWREKVGEFDVNKDGKLTHVEIALRFAKLRGVDGVIQIDRDFAGKHLRRHDRNANGQLDPNEIANGWPDEPEEYDKNGDGVITLREITVQLALLRVVRKASGIMGVDQGGATKIMNRFDKNSNRRLDASEWDAASLPRDPKNFDENNDDTLSVMEVATMLAKHRMESGLSLADQFQARSMVKRIDRDSNGILSSKEMEMAKALGIVNIDLAAFDGDKNGEVTMAEVEAGLASERKQKGYMDKHAQQAERLMVRHDKNRNGFIDENELFENAVTGQLSVDVLEKIDLDQDMKITKEELAKHLAAEEKK